MTKIVYTVSGAKVLVNDRQVLEVTGKTLTLTQLEKILNANGIEVEWDDLSDDYETEEKFHR